MINIEPWNDKPLFGFGFHQLSLDDNVMCQWHGMRGAMVKQISALSLSILRMK